MFEWYSEQPPAVHEGTFQTSATGHSPRSQIKFMISHCASDRASNSFASVIVNSSLLEGV